MKDLSFAGKHAPPTTKAVRVVVKSLDQNVKVVESGMVQAVKLAFLLSFFLRLRLLLGRLLRSLRDWKEVSM